ncbi:nuclear transport factor 2 family protein [Terriglobus albidus]|uniref:Nuclear transport factor 2 family protein n=1 Tax=Terriglobus albidus TaxID=1592106 RepID=A0A5B9E4S4_9BACT|nr:nuclear transport factor 2 family protein [Terriglobus albidus]QEE27252.1 nuclear transport factor 2 family protein [Terriglobus albidus]
MTKSDAEALIKDYLHAYGNISQEERRQLLLKAVSDDVVSTNPAEESHGFDGLLAHVEQFQQRLPGAYFRLNKLLTHHSQVLLEWTLYKGDDTVVTTAHTHGVFSDQGRLKQLTGFF